MMGHGQKESIDQSQKKPKILKGTKKREAHQWTFGAPNTDERDALFLSDDVVGMMKQMRPKHLAKFSLKSKWL